VELNLIVKTLELLQSAIHNPITIKSIFKERKDKPSFAIFNKIKLLIRKKFKMGN